MLERAGLDDYKKVQSVDRCSRLGNSAVRRNAHARDAHASRVPRVLESVENYPCPRQ